MVAAQTVETMEAERMVEAQAVEVTLDRGDLSHPVLEGKPNAHHVRDRISNSRTQQLHNWTSSHNAQIIV
jgi:hypothetical protein